MKKTIYLFVLSVIVSQCASNKPNNKMPFSIKNATYITNTNTLLVEYASEQQVLFQEVFYNNSKAKAVMTAKDGKKYVSGTFKKLALQDLNLHADPKQEYGNKPVAKSQEDMPVLKDNEALISYMDNGKIKYYRLTSIAVSNN